LFDLPAGRSPVEFTEAVTGRFSSVAQRFALEKPARACAGGSPVAQFVSEAGATEEGADVFVVGSPLYIPADFAREVTAQFELKE
jgi:hypothetical protein